MELETRLTEMVKLTMEQITILIQHGLNVYTYLYGSGSPVTSDILTVFFIYHYRY